MLRNARPSFIQRRARILHHGVPMPAKRLLPLLLWILCRADIVAQQHTPPADYSREPYVIEQSRTAWRFENNGTGRKDAYVRVKVQSEASVQRWGQLVL